jgi:WD40 repeat protein
MRARRPSATARLSARALVFLSAAALVHSTNSAEPGSRALSTTCLCETASFNLPSGESIYAVQLSPNGRQLACATANGAVWIYNVSNYRAQHVVTIKNPTDGPITSLTYTSDGRWLLCAYAAELIVIYDIRRGGIADQVHCNGYVMEATISPNAKHIAVGYWTDNGLGQLDQGRLSSDGKLHDKRRLGTFEDWIQRMEYSLDSKLLAVDTHVPAGPELIRMWSTTPPQELQSITCINGARSSTMRVGPEGSSLAIGGYYADACFGVQIWNLRNRQNVRVPLPGAASHRPLMAISGSLKWGATANLRSTILSLWDLDAKRCLATTKARERLQVIAFCKTSDQIAVAGEHGYVAVYRIRKEKTKGSG